MVDSYQSHTFEPKNGDLVTNTNPNCKHRGSRGTVLNILPLDKDMGKIVKYSCTNSGPHWNRGDVLEKTLDQLSPSGPIVQKGKNMDTIREYVRRVLIKEAMGRSQDVGDATVNFPEPEPDYLTALASGIMIANHREKLLSVFDSYKSNVSSFDSDGERVAAFKELRSTVSNPARYILKIDNSSEFWVGLAALVHPENAGQIMGERLSYRQTMVDDTLEVIKQTVSDTVGEIIDKVKENPESIAHLWDIYQALPQSSAEDAKAGILSQNEIKAAIATIVIQTLGKRLLGITAIAAAASTFYDLYRWQSFKSDLVDLADKLTGDSSITLNNQFLPASFHNKNFLKSAGGLADGILAPPSDSDAAAIRRAQEEQEKEMWGNN